MTTLRVQVSLPNVNGIPADTITNTWHCKSNFVDPVDGAEDFVNDLVTFYEAIDIFLSTSIDPIQNFTVYDLESPIPRAPIYTFSNGLTLGANAPLPHECAIVLSYNGANVSGIPAGRRRGRIFLGPLDSAVMDDSGGQSIIQLPVIEAIRDAADALMTAGDPGETQWAVFSPTTAGPPPWTVSEINGSTLSVTHGFVDNAFDTVRSRGTLASARVTFS